MIWNRRLDGLTALSVGIRFPRAARSVGGHHDANGARDEGVAEPI
jgi:hypothetical protein